MKPLGDGVGALPITTGRRVAVLGVCDQFGRYLAASRMVIDLEQLRDGWLAESSRYLLPCEMTDKHGCTIELFARIQVIASPEAE